MIMRGTINWKKTEYYGNLQSSDTRYIINTVALCCDSWWHHQMETFSAWLAICAGNSPVTGEFHERPVTLSFDVFLDLCLNKGWVNNRDAGDLRRHRANYDVIEMLVRFGVEFTYVLQAHFPGAGVGHVFFPVSVTQPLGTWAPMARLVGPMLGQRCTCWPTSAQPTLLSVGSRSSIH